MRDAITLTRKKAQRKINAIPTILRRPPPEARAGRLQVLRDGANTLLPSLPSCCRGATPPADGISPPITLLAGANTSSALGRRVPTAISAASKNNIILRLIDMPPCGRHRTRLCFRSRAPIFSVSLACFLRISPSYRHLMNDFAGRLHSAKISAMTIRAHQLCAFYTTIL